jgi:hypothetical protein
VITEQTITELRERGVILSRNGDRLHVDAPKGVVTPELREMLVRYKVDLLDVLTTMRIPATAADRAETPKTFHGYTLADLHAAAHPDEWAEVKDMPETLEVFARSLLERRQIEAGVVPERFTKLARCSGCGAVMVPATWPTERRQTRLGQYAVETWDEATSCPWCRLRVEGRHYPRVHPADEHGRPLPRPITWQGKEERAVNAGTGLSAGEPGTESRVLF